MFFEKDKKTQIHLLFSLLFFMFVCIIPLFCPMETPAAMVVSGFEIRKNFPVFEKELRRVIPIRIGEEYSPEKVEGVVKRIEGLYQDEGYMSVRVEPRVKEKVPGKEVTLIFVINKGPKTRIRDILIVDDRSDEKPDIQEFLQIRQGQVFKRKRVEESIKALEDFLVRSGYLKADVKYLREEQEDGLSVEIYVYRGPRLDIYIEGNKHFQEAVIRDHMTFFENRFFDIWEVDESIQKIKDLYMDEGFIHCRIDAELGDAKEGEDSRVSFKITEGERIYLKRIFFGQKSSIKQKRLKRQFLSIRSLSLFRRRPYKAITFEEDLDAVDALYRSEGFPDANIYAQTVNLGENRIEKEIIIEEGRREMVGRISFTGNHYFSDDRLNRMIKISEGGPLRPEELEDSRRAIVTLYGNSGYPYAKVSVRKKVVDGGFTDVIFDIQEGSFARFGRIVIQRNLKTREKVIRSACSFKEGEPFSYQKILDTQERLSRLGLFRSLGVEPKREEQGGERIDCIIEVEEMKTGQINLGGGFSSRRGYRGYLEIREDNLTGRAISGSFRADYAGIGRDFDLVDDIGRTEKYTIALRDPLLIPRHKVEGESKIYNSTEDRKEYHSRSNGFSIGFWRPHRRKVRIGLTYHIDLNRLKDITIDPNQIPERYEDHTISAIGPTFIYDSRDNFLDPREGIYTNLSLDWAGSWIGGDQDFYKAKAEVRLFFPLSSKLIMAINVRGGYIGLHGRTTKVPIQERFFAGGMNTVRGFREDSLGPKDPGTDLPLGGRVLWINNLELRFPLYKQLRCVLFYDAGNVWGTKGDMESGDLRKGAGVGLRWITPIGPIRLDYGVPIDRKPGESTSRAYLSVGHAF